MQNFRAKPGTAMRHAPEPQDEEFLAAVATARVVLGPHMSVQAPPNLSDPAQQLRLLDAGINDWGGVSPLTPDHVNPEKPWPTLAALTGHHGRARLRAPRATHDLRPVRGAPRSVPRIEDARAGRRVARPRRPRRRGTGARTHRLAGPGRPVEAPDDRADCSPRPPTPGLRDDAMAVYGDFDALDVTRDWSKRDVTPERLEMEIKVALTKAASHRADHRRRTRSRCSAPKARRSTRSAGWPTTFGRRPSATTSPT